MNRLRKLLAVLALSLAVFTTVIVSHVVVETVYATMSGGGGGGTDIAQQGTYKVFMGHLDRTSTSVTFFTDDHVSFRWLASDIVDWANKSSQKYVSITGSYANGGGAGSGNLSSGTATDFKRTYVNAVQDTWYRVAQLNSDVASGFEFKMLNGNGERLYKVTGLTSSSDADIRVWTVELYDMSGETQNSVVTD